MAKLRSFLTLNKLSLVTLIVLGSLLLTQTSLALTGGETSVGVPGPLAKLMEDIMAAPVIRNELSQLQLEGKLLIEKSSHISRVASIACRVSASGANFCSEVYLVTYKVQATKSGEEELHAARGIVVPSGELNVELVDLKIN